MKNMMRGLINEHLADIDYDSPRDFIDVYLKQIHENGSDFDIEHLVVICLDFFQAGGETTRYAHCATGQFYQAKLSETSSV